MTIESFCLTVRIVDISTNNDTTAKYITAQPLVCEKRCRVKEVSQIKKASTINNNNNYNNSNSNSNNNNYYLPVPEPVVLGRHPRKDRFFIVQKYKNKLGLIIFCYLQQKVSLGSHDILFLF